MLAYIDNPKDICVFCMSIMPEIQLFKMEFEIEKLKNISSFMIQNFK